MEDQSYYQKAVFDALERDSKRSILTAIYLNTRPARYNLCETPWSLSKVDSVSSVLICEYILGFIGLE